MHYLPLDLETTGLRPTEDRICEVAWTILNPDFSQHMLDLRSFVPVPSIATWQLLEDNQFVWDMHAKTGLLDEMTAIAYKGQEGLELSDIEDAILADINAGVPEGEPVALLGSSVHFDLRFIIQWMPRLAERLHYRVLDTSTLEAFMEQAAPTLKLNVVNRNQHRAADDIREDIEIVRQYRDWTKRAFTVMTEYALAPSQLRPEQLREVEAQRQGGTIINGVLTFEDDDPRHPEDR